MDFFRIETTRCVALMYSRGFDVVLKDGAIVIGVLCGDGIFCPSKIIPIPKSLAERAFAPQIVAYTGEFIDEQKTERYDAEAFKTFVKSRGSYHLETKEGNGGTVALIARFVGEKYRLPDVLISVWYRILDDRFVKEVEKEIETSEKTHRRFWMPQDRPAVYVGSRAYALGPNGLFIRDSCHEWWRLWVEIPPEIIASWQGEQGALPAGMFFDSALWRRMVDLQKTYGQRNARTYFSIKQQDRTLVAVGEKCCSRGPHPGADHCSYAETCTAVAPVGGVLAYW